MSTNQMPRVGNGSLRLFVGRKFYTVWGGPFRQKPDVFFGVKLAPEIKDLVPIADVELPIRDFTCPTAEQVDKALPAILDLILSRKPVYIGCMGGKGRTGLVLAILAKVFGSTSPVEFVRATYYPHAVETAEQYAFVQNYTPKSDVMEQLARAHRWSNFSLWFRTDLTAKP
jgi:hypothetical protein